MPKTVSSSPTENGSERSVYPAITQLRLCPCSSARARAAPTLSGCLFKMETGEGLLLNEDWVMTLIERQANL